MITVGLLLFIIIVGISTITNRKKRYVDELELEEIRKKNKNAIEKLHRATEISISR